MPNMATVLTTVLMYSLVATDNLAYATSSTFVTAKSLALEIEQREQQRINYYGEETKSQRLDSPIPVN